jgi:WhiB family redox-sensing transcriptional regulator
MAEARQETPADSTRRAWRDDALCRETDPEAFYPDRGESAQEALSVCRRCPVTAECLAFALAHDERFGVWGGTTEADRQRLRRLQQEAADDSGHTPGLSARGNGVWAVSVRYRRRDGRAQLSTTVTGGRAAALRRLAELRAQAGQAQAAHDAGEGRGAGRRDAGTAHLPDLRPGRRLLHPALARPVPRLPRPRRRPRRLNPPAPCG